MSIYQHYPTKFYPGSEIDYGRDWSDSLKAVENGKVVSDGSILKSTWRIESDNENPPMLLESDIGAGISSDRKITSIFLKGGTNGVKYKLINDVVIQMSNKTLLKLSKLSVLTCSEEC